MTHKFINEINAGETVDDIYMATQPILRSTSRGDLYIAMYLSDRTGQLNGRMWQATEQIYNALDQAGFVHIKGRSEIYQNAMQVIINDVRVVDAESVSLDDFLPKCEKDIGKMFAEVKTIVSQIKNQQLKTLIEAFLDDDELMKKYCQVPGGVKMHHSYLGGMLEHTLSMLKVAKVILPLYPNVQADLVLAGIFLHDIGKTKELSYEIAFSYTDAGQLVGHLVQSVVMINEKVKELAEKDVEFDGAILNVLEHIILSHHGQYEFGSPKLPAMAEAFMVNYIDDLDAKMNQVTGAIENDPGDSNWTEWKRGLETRLYRKRVIE